MRAVYVIARHQLCAHAAVVTRLIQWLTRNAEWEGTRYTDTGIPSAFQLEGYEPAWCGDMHLLRSLSST